MNVKKCHDAFCILEVDGRDLLICLELSMAFLKERLKLVNFENLLRRVCFRIEVGNQRKYAVGRCFLLYGVLVDMKGKLICLFPSDAIRRLLGATSFL